MTTKRAPGGGRKPSPHRGIPLGLTVPPAIFEQIKSEAETLQLTPSQFAVWVLRAYCKKPL